MPSSATLPESQPLLKPMTPVRFLFPFSTSTLAQLFHAIVAYTCFEFFSVHPAQSATAVTTMATPFFDVCPAGSAPALTASPQLVATTAAPAIGSMLSIAPASAAAVTLPATVYCGFASGLGAGFSVWTNGTCMVPTQNVTAGQTYVALVSGPSISDASILAGYVLFFSLLFLSLPLLSFFSFCDLQTDLSFLCCCFGIDLPSWTLLPLKRSPQHFSFCTTFFLVNVMLLSFLPHLLLSSLFLSFACLFRLLNEAGEGKALG